MVGEAAVRYALLGDASGESGKMVTLVAPPNARTGAGLRAASADLLDRLLHRRHAPFDFDSDKQRPQRLPLRGSRARGWLFSISLGAPAMGL